MDNHKFVAHCHDWDCPIWTCRRCFQDESHPSHNLAKKGGFQLSGQDRPYDTEAEALAAWEKADPSAPEAESGP